MPSEWARPVAPARIATNAARRVGMLARAVLRRLVRGLSLFAWRMTDELGRDLVRRDRRGGGMRRAGPTGMEWRDARAGPDLGVGLVGLPLPDGHAGRAQPGAALRVAVGRDGGRRGGGAQPGAAFRGAAGRGPAAAPRRGVGRARGGGPADEAGAGDTVWPGPGARDAEGDGAGARRGGIRRCDPAR